MTDKELKKLSRLELLELLLTESRENERLREELERVKRENSVEKSAQHLNETSAKLNSALNKVSSMLSGVDISTIADLDEDQVDDTYEPDSAEAVKTSETTDTQNADTKTKTAAISETSETKKENEPNSEKDKPIPAYKSVDYNIYKNLMVFFIKNPYSLAVLPDDLRKDITDRIDDIKSKLKAKNNN